MDESLLLLSRSGDLLSNSKVRRLSSIEYPASSLISKRRNRTAVAARPLHMNYKEPRPLTCNWGISKFLFGSGGDDIIVRAALNVGHDYLQPLSTSTTPLQQLSQTKGGNMKMHRDDTKAHRLLPSAGDLRHRAFVPRPSSCLFMQISCSSGMVLVRF